MRIIKLLVSVAIFIATSTTAQDYQDYADGYEQQDNLYENYAMKQQEKGEGGGGCVIILNCLYLMYALVFLHILCSLTLCGILPSCNLIILITSYNNANHKHQQLNITQYGIWQNNRSIRYIIPNRCQDTLWTSF